MNYVNTNWGVIGHENILRYLDLLNENKNYAHTYIFSGPGNVGKTKVLEKFISQIIKKENQTLEKLKNSNIDFYYLEKPEDKKDIIIDQVKELIRKLQMSSFSDNYKIAVIKDAENLNQSSSNALLKLLEEPSRKTIIFLLTNNVDHLLDTIKSRAVNLNFKQVDIDKIYQYLKANNNNFEIPQLKMMAKLSVGRPGIAISYLHNPQKFAKIKDMTNAIVEVLDKPLHEQFAFFKEAIEEQENIELLNIILRDIFLLQNNSPDSLVNTFVKEKLEVVKHKIDKSSVIKMLNQLHEYEDAKKYNINKLLFLENLILNI